MGEALIAWLITASAVGLLLAVIVGGGLALVWMAPVPRPFRRARTRQE